MNFNIFYPAILTSINRNLFTYERLGITKYESARKIVKQSIEHQSFFKQNFKKRLPNPEYDLQRLELDLKNFVHLMTTAESDFDLLKNALAQLVNKRQSYEGYKYDYGPIVMRMFYFLKMPNEALKV